MESRRKQIDANYYISRVLIPPLERIFNLVGADVRQWYDDMPKSIRAQPDSHSPVKVEQDDGMPDRLNNIDEHFRSSQCFICGALASEGTSYSQLFTYSNTTYGLDCQGYATIAVSIPRQQQQPCYTV